MTTTAIILITLDDLEEDTVEIIGARGEPNQGELFDRAIRAIFDHRAKIPAKSLYHVSFTPEWPTAVVEADTQAQAIVLAARVVCRFNKQDPHKFLRKHLSAAVVTKEG